jgi:hypothetical protein
MMADGTMVSSDDSTNGSGFQASPPGFFRVVRNGVHCIGLTNGQVVSGTVTIPLEIAAPDGDPITGAVLQVEGNPAPGGAALQGANNLWTFTWDTTAIPNGIHQVTAAVIFGEDATDIEMTNSLTVAITNVLSFPYYFTQEYGVGNEMWVYAQTIQPNIYWEVDVYASQTNYLGYFDDYSSDGSINFVWGLQTNQNFPPLTDTSFLLDYYLWDADTGEPLNATPAGNPVPEAPGAVASKCMIGENSWSINSMAVACCAVDGNINHTFDVQSMMRDGVLTSCQAQFRGGLQPQPNDPHGEPWTWGDNGDKYGSSGKFVPRDVVHWDPGT